MFKKKKQSFCPLFFVFLLLMLRTRLLKIHLFRGGTITRCQIFTVVSSNSKHIADSFIPTKYPMKKSIQLGKFQHSMHS
uniref:Putative secreted protein n=1 Tax=Panstrongylus lignarius TaxID=156445 RepID=A0A224XT17_9HEMI